MKTIFADFNAMTEDGRVRLTTLGSQDDIRRARIGVGDWAWLSDGELIVGAQLADDPENGLVGIPAWDTLVHLDEEGAGDSEQLKRELLPMLQNTGDSNQDETRIFQLMTQFECAATSSLQESGFFSMRRALSLRKLGRTGLALLEINDARRVRPDDLDATLVYLDLLRRHDLPAAREEAESLASRPDVPSVILTGCITILATVAEGAPDGRFEPTARRVLEWCDRLMQRRDLAGVQPSLIALTFFNQGVILLRMGRIAEAQDAFRHAHDHYPIEANYDEATRLTAYDRRAQDLSHRVLDQPLPISTPIAA